MFHGKPHKGLSGIGKLNTKLDGLMGKVSNFTGSLLPALSALGRPIKEYGLQRSVKVKELQERCLIQAFNLKKSMSMLVQKSQVHKTKIMSQDDDKRLCLVDDLKEAQVYIQVKLFGTSSNLKSKITTSCSQDEVQKTNSSYSTIWNLNRLVSPKPMESPWKPSPSQPYDRSVEGQYAVFILHNTPYCLEEQIRCLDCRDQYPVLSRRTVVYTDQSALRHLFKRQDAKPRLIHWILLLHEFDIEIKGKKGIENVVADHLSQIDNDETSDDSDVDDDFPSELLWK
ncbi:hypothetical protein Tco_0852873 [Tanacetum coccineum]